MRHMFSPRPEEPDSSKPGPVTSPGFFFFWNITSAIGLASQPGQDQFPPSWLGSASPHSPTSPRARHRAA